MKPRVAVIDIGSNSIKALVAESSGGPFGLRAIFAETLEVRISKGIGGTPPMLQADRIEAGIKAVRQLWKACEQNGPIKDVQVVATSAVRSAANGEVFIEGVANATGLSTRILTGAEEADAIAMGVRTDPGIEDNLTDFTVFDLGGGSLELIRFEHHGVTNRTSLPLGAVRLTEQFVPDATRPVPIPEQKALSEFVHSHIVATGIEVKAPVVGCSGGLAAIRQIMNNRFGSPASESSAFISREFLDTLTSEIVDATLAGRIAIPGMPEQRADIFPAALLVFRVILDLTRADGILHSFHNLRYGLALRLLQTNSTP